MSGRFRLDPRAPAPERAPPPAPPSPTARPASPPPAAPRPAASPAPADAPTTRRKALLVGGLVVALLLVGGAVAVFAATQLGYPDKYFLGDGDMPSGVSEARMSRAEMDELGITENPGELDVEARDGLPTSDENKPDEAHVQVLATSAGSRIMVLALDYASEADARSAASELRAACTFASGTVMRDGDVVVAVIPEDGGARSSVRAIALAIMENASGLERVCGL